MSKKKISMLLSATENSILKFLTVSSVSSDSIVKGIIWSSGTVVLNGNNNLNTT